MTKQHIDQLAIFGGAPVFETPLHVGRPNIGDRDRLMQRFHDILDRRWLTNDGPVVREFEQRVAELVGVRHCVAMCNGTVALEIAIRATGLSGEVIVPSFTFIATAHALQWQQITPVFCDIDPATHNLDPARVESLITPRTTGIIGVHVWGRPCAIETLGEIAARHHLTLMFDAAHAFGCSHRGRMIGSFGSAEILSFHATKFVNSFEGGAVLTDDDELASRMRLMRNFGFAGNDNVIFVGTNGKMCEMAAAMGLTSLDAMDEIISINERNYHRYRNGIEGLAGLSLIRYNPAQWQNYQYVVLEVDESAELGRDHLVEILTAEGVLARRYFYPGVHNMQPYRAHFPHAHLLLPETEALGQRVLLLPTGTAITEPDVDTITALLRFSMEHGKSIGKRLSHTRMANATT